MLETINWLALTIPFIAAGATYITLEEKRWPKLIAGLAAAAILVAIFFGYTFVYLSIGFPLWMGWFAPASEAESLPGRPEVQINTKLNADWTIVGMNYDWMALVAKAHLQIGSRPEIYMRFEHVSPQDSGDGKKYLSEVNWVELDCAAGRMNTLVITSYAGNNLSGGEVYSGRSDPRNPEWDTPEPKSIFAASVRKGCELIGQ
ncbi:MAG: hypothetical protein KJ622_12660 [Alphaproteobacteria bacterium]|nr:hypothetical protein [Alphaproteobacteria bacterium]